MSSGTDTGPQRLALSQAQVEEFFTVGWVILPQLFSAAEVQGMRRSFDRLARRATRMHTSGDHRGSRFVVDRQGPAGSVRIHRVVWCGACEPALLAHGRDPRLTRPVADLLGSATLIQLINQAHFKMPGDGVAFPWHQDSTHRRYGQPEWSDPNGKGSYVQTLVAVDPMTPQNGPLRLIPGSCTLGHVDDPDYRVDEREALNLTMNPGDVAMFGPYTFHASGPNRSSRQRRALINGFAYPGANRRNYPGAGTGSPYHVCATP